MTYQCLNSVLFPLGKLTGRLKHLSSARRMFFVFGCMRRRSSIPSRHPDRVYCSTSHKWFKKHLTKTFWYDGGSMFWIPEQDFCWVFIVFLILFNIDGIIADVFWLSGRSVIVKIISPFFFVIHMICWYNGEWIQNNISYGLICSSFNTSLFNSIH